MLKAAIIILFLGVVASLSSGLVYLVKDMGVPESKRALYALGIRITLAATLMLLIAYGLTSGQLGSTAPWDRWDRPAATPSLEQSAPGE